jgi:hypothetical protein
LVLCKSVRALFLPGRQTGRMGGRQVEGRGSRRRGRQAWKAWGRLREPSKQEGSCKIFRKGRGG